MFNINILLQNPEKAMKVDFQKHALLWNRETTSVWGTSICDTLTIYF